MYASKLIENYAAVRGRLWGYPETVVAPRPKLEFLPEEETHVVEARKVVFVEGGSAPLTMLGECSWRFLVCLAALRHEVGTKDILGKSKTDNICPARDEAIYLIAKHTDYSIAAIGRLVGRHHSTCLYSLSKFPKLVREVNLTKEDPKKRRGKRKAFKPEPPTKPIRKRGKLDWVVVAKEVDG